MTDSNTTHALNSASDMRELHTARLRTSEALATARQELRTWADLVRQGAEARTGSVHPDTVVQDPAYDHALDLLGPLNQSNTAFTRLAKRIEAGAVMDTHALVLQLPGACHPGRGGFTPCMRVFFAYVAADPYALRMRIDTGRSAPPVRWDFARELLADERHHPSGTGNVHITPEPADLVSIELSAPTGTAPLRFQHAQLAHVLELSEQLVPLGAESEHIDWDHALTILAEGGDR